MKPTAIHKILLPAILGLVGTACTSSSEVVDFEKEVSTVEQALSGDGHQVLAAKGFNWARIRLFTDDLPYNHGQQQDLAYVKDSCKKARAAGMSVLIDLQMSPNWADPGNQVKPAGINSTGDAYNYARNVMIALRDTSGCGLPNMVQAGNETNAGSMWPNGQVTWNPDYFGNYVSYSNSVYDGIKSVGNIPVMIHYAGIVAAGNDPVWWYNAFKSAGGKFDVIGLSYYEMWHGSRSALANTFNTLRSNHGKDMYMVETADYWKASEAGESTSYPHTLSGQQSALAATINAVKYISGFKGIFYWGAGVLYPENWDGGHWNWSNQDWRTRGLFNDSAGWPTATINPAAATLGGSSLAVRGVDTSEIRVAEQNGVVYTDGSAPAPYCGDGSCNNGETCSSCSSDCGACAGYCGDGSCNNGEDCSSCSSDCGACGGGGGGTGAYTMSGNQVSMEAENADQSISGNSGDSFQNNGGVMECLSDSGDYWTSGIEANAPRMEFQVNFDGTGTFYAHARAAGPHGASDSLHIGLDGVVVHNNLGINSSNVLSWANSSGFNVSSTGVHTIIVYAREDGARVDQVIVNKSSGTPSWTGESPRGSGGGGGGAYCGDGSCNNGETCSSCSQDCGACAAYCGDGSCNGGETCSSCSQDCGACAAYCGDGSCNNGETCSSCSQDCGSCGSAAWQMSGGSCSMEAENHVSVVASGDTFTNSGGIMECTPDTGDYWTTNASSAPRMDYTVNFDQTGTFYVHALATGVNGSNNSLHVGLDGTIVHNNLGTNETGVLTWANSNGFTVSSTGQHTISIYAREDGVRVDKVIVNKSSGTPGWGGESGFW